MEHLLFHLIVETITAIDRRLQRPIGVAIPELAQLRADPLGYLMRSPIEIGPRRRHALATVCGFLAALAVLIVLLILFANAPRVRGVNWSRFAGVLVSFVLVLLVVRALMLRWMLGGTLTLRAEGAELAYRERIVFLPWPLFRARGSIFEPDAKLAVLPIDPTVPVAVSGPGDQIQALLPAELELPQAGSSDFGQLAIKDMYEVRVGELAMLLHEIGRRIRGDFVEQLAPTMTQVPLAVPLQDGWLCVQLTQLPFPPYCASCGNVTTATLDVPVVKFGQVNKIAVPYCATCAGQRMRRRVIGTFIGALVGLVIAVGLSRWIAGRPGNVETFILAMVAMIPAIGIPSAIVGNLIGRDMRMPVRCKDYQPEKGSVRMRLRDPMRAAPLLHAMGLTVAAEPDPEAILN